MNKGRHTTVRLRELEKSDVTFTGVFDNVLKSNGVLEITTDYRRTCEQMTSYAGARIGEV